MRSADGCIKLVSKGVYRVRITVGYDPDTGKQVWASKNVRGTRKTAEDAKDALKRKYRTADMLVYGRMTVYLLAKEDIERRKNRKRKPLAETTLRGYEATLENHIRPRFEYLKVADTRKFHIQSALDAIKSPGAALNAYKLLHAVFRDAKDSEWIVSNPMADIAPPETPEYFADTYTLDEVLRIHEWARERGVDESFEAGLIVATWAGTRASETCALDRSDIVLDRERNPVSGEWIYHGTVDISKAYHALPGRRVMADTKTERSSRVIALPEFASERLWELLGPNRVGALMLDATGQRMTPGGFSERWRRLMKPRKNKRGETIYQPPVRYLELKILRHSRITNLLELGTPMEWVSADAGHSVQRTTETVYNRRRRKAVDGTAAAFDRAIQDKRADAGPEKRGHTAS